jgi:hypothetical protein
MKNRLSHEALKEIITRKAPIHKGKGRKKRKKKRTISLKEKITNLEEER